MTRSHHQCWSQLGVVGLAGWLVLWSAMAAVPHLIRYQGQAVDRNQVPLEGPYTLTFRLYDAATAGAKLWEEVQPNVPVTGGVFSVLLGQVTPLDPVDWTQPRWLSIQVNTEPELLPRQRITSVPLALRAEVAEGLTAAITPSLISPQGAGSGLNADAVDGQHAADLLNRANHTGTQPSSTITDDANRFMPSGAIILWNGGACPTGYTRVSALDGKFLVADATYNAAAGGNNTVTPTGSLNLESGHTHTVPHSEWIGSQGGNPVGTINLLRATFDSSGATADRQTTGNTGHTHTFTGNAFDNRPAYATILLCRKN